MSRIPALTLLFLASACLSNAFYVPGVAPVEFRDGEEVEIKGVKITSTKTQLPYDYYSIGICTPALEKIVYMSENLGEVLRGDRIVNTLYKVPMKTDTPCKVMCLAKYTKDQAKIIADRIKEDYNVHLLADNLPAATVVTQATKEEPAHYVHGYKLGIVIDNVPFINNHLVMNMKYHPVETEEGGVTVVNNRVISFEVFGRSIHYDKLTAEKEDNCKLPELKGKETVAPQVFEGDKEVEVKFSYEVHWEESNIKWASRWDTYLNMTDVQIHWFSIINSLVVVFFLAGILTMIMIRTLRKDIARYNKDEDVEDTMEETGWKLVHGDVFRPPKAKQILAALVGTGVQIFVMAIVTLSFAMFGMLSPSSRGALLSACLFLFVFLGVFAGYFSGRLYKTMKGTQWIQSALLTGFLYPGIIFTTTFLLNFFIWGKHSSGAVPFSTMIALVCMWNGISLPLVVLGHYFGYRKQPYAHPVRTNQIPRQVPEQVWYLNPLLSAPVAGILSFGAVFIELVFIMQAIWENQFYYLFGFLFVVFLILVVSCAQISIVMVYFQLCSEDYHWWWRSFLVSGGSALYIFIYSVFYFVTKLEITQFVPALLYFGYTFMMVLTFWIITGTMGFFAAYWFIVKIYGAVKID